MARRGNSNHSTAVKAGKPDRRKNEYRQAIKQVFSQEDFIALLQTLKEEALSGNMKALELALNYTIGKPSEHLQIENIEPRQFTVEVVDTPQGSVTTLANEEGEPLVKFG